MSKAYLILVLHAHMPYVFNSGNEITLEERLLYESICECYIRLIQVFDHLRLSSIPFSLTLSLSPILLSQLEHPKMPEKFIKYLSNQIKLAEKEISRTKNISDLAPLSRMYKGFYEDALKTFEIRCNRNIIKTLSSFQDEGFIELITCPATHPYLPLLRPNPSAIRAQINVALTEYSRLFGKKPKAIWLPECGYFPDLDKFLLEAGITSTFLDTYTIKRAKPKPKFDTYIPIISPSGLIVFGRDPYCAKQVWSSIDGYPGDPDYRDFYRDIGFDLDIGYLSPFMPGRDRTFTGFKYYSIKSEEGKKGIYAPEISAQKVSIHVDDFLAHRLNQIRELSFLMDHPFAICAFYDAELFGHWWFEGPLWLETLFKKLTKCNGYLTPATTHGYMEKNAQFQKASLPGGSWGWKGFNEVWLNASNKWVYPHLFKAGEKMEEIANGNPKDNLERRACNQAGKELFLAHSSDWTFMLHINTFSDYASKRIREHLGRFWKLIEQIETKTIDREWLKHIEEVDNIFPTFTFKDFTAV